MFDWVLRIVSMTALADEAGAAADEVGAAGWSEWLGMLLPLVLIFGAMYFIMIRPQRKKDKKVKAMLNNLKVTDRVTTIGGIHGTIVSIKDDNVTLHVGKDNVPLVMARWAIRSIEEETLENDAEALN
ncbi:MAG: preprotein translocase subunit YajC [Clostridia bacterium]|nr:preprotein translocase subunit YajC [Clostridia bacterium]